MKTVRAWITSVGRGLQDRWAWYRAQRRVAFERRWWDAYHA